MSKQLLTSFALQVIKEKLIRKQRQLFFPQTDACFNASSIKKSSHQVQQANIGAATTEHKAKTIQKHQH